MKIVAELSLDEWTTITKALIIVGGKCAECARKYADCPNAGIWAKAAKEYQDAYKCMQNAHTAACEKLLKEMKEAIDHEKH